MTFGLTIAPATLQQLVEKTTKNLSTSHHIDNLIVLTELIKFLKDTELQISR